MDQCIECAAYRQAANNADFDAVVKFDSAMSSRFQMQGLTAEQNNTNLVRFDVYSDGSVTTAILGQFCQRRGDATHLDGDHRRCAVVSKGTASRQPMDGILFH